MKYDYMKNQNIQIRKGWKALLWNQVKSKMESSYSELVLVDDNDIDNLVVNICIHVSRLFGEAQLNFLLLLFIDAGSKLVSL